MTVECSPKTKLAFVCYHFCDEVIRKSGLEIDLEGENMDELELQTVRYAVNSFFGTDYTDLDIRMAYLLVLEQATTNEVNYLVTNRNNIIEEALGRVKTNRVSTLHELMRFKIDWNRA